MAVPGSTIWASGRGLFRVPARSTQSELLDVPGHDLSTLSNNLRDIRRVNRLLGGVSAITHLLPVLLAGRAGDQPVAILDLATGSADIPVAIATWARRQDREVSIVASDIFEDVLSLARQQAGDHPEITFGQFDARSVPFADRSFDIVLCSLALHHFTPEDAVLVLREMARLGRLGFIVNDLRRSRVGYVAAWVASHLTTTNRLTRHDAPLSVRRAYTPIELSGLLRQASVDGAIISTRPWFRMTAVHNRTQPDGL